MAVAIHYVSGDNYSPCHSSSYLLHMRTSAQLRFDEHAKLLTMIAQIDKL
jgi:hypothetical protein